MTELNSPHASKKGDEQRRFPRLDLNVRVQWKKYVVDDECEDKDTTKNVSTGGACLGVNKKVAVNEKLALLIELPAKKMIYATGRVAWVKEVRGGGGAKYEVGVEFLNLSDKDREALRKSCSLLESR